MRNWLFLFCLGVMVSCDPPGVDEHSFITVVNDSEMSIDVSYDLDYPDRDFGPYDIHNYMEEKRRVFPHSSSNKPLGLPEWDSWENRFRNRIESDTLIIHIFDSRVIDNNTWSDIRREYMVEQVYYVSLDDLEALDWTVSYPPSEKMKDVKKE